MGPWEIEVKINGQIEPVLIEECISVDSDSLNYVVELADGSRGQIDGYSLQKLVEHKPAIVPNKVLLQFRLCQ
jgi:hypothetical protein